MKKFIINLFSAVLLFSGLTHIVLAQNQGTIRFSGTIVEEPCQITNQQSSLTGECSRDNKVKSVSVSNSRMMSGQQVYLPYNLGKMTFKPVDNNPKLVRVDIDYL